MTKFPTSFMGTLVGNFKEPPCWPWTTLTFHTPVPKAQPASMHRNYYHCLLAVFFPEKKMPIYAASATTQLESCLQQLEESPIPNRNGNSPPCYEVIMQLIRLYFMLLCLHSISYFNWGLVRLFPNGFTFGLVFSRFGLFCWQIIWGQTKTSNVKYSQRVLGWKL